MLDIKTEEKEKVILQKTFEELEKERTMKLSIKEGSATAAMSGFGDSYITPFAISLNANNVQIGLLSSFSGLIPPIFQIIGSRMMEKYSRKTIIFFFVVLQAFMWIPISFLAYLLWKGLLVSYLPYLLITFYSIYAIFGALVGPSWFSMMGDIVPEKIRGAYFSRRNTICGSVALVATLIAGFLLDYFKTRGFVLLGFTVLFILSFSFRMLSAIALKKHYNPEFNVKEDYYFGFWKFVRKSPSNNFGRFVIFISLMYLAANIVGPFFNVYMLRDLNFSYTTFMFVNLASSIAALLFMPLLGRISDKYGNRELLRIGSILIPINPFFWLVSSSPIYLMLVPQVISGIGWAAFGLASSNFVYDTVTPQRRGLCVAYLNLLNGAGIFFGATLGGLISTHINIGFMNSILFLAVISGICRFLVLFLIRIVKEVRPVDKPKANLFLYIKEIRPFSGFTFGSIGRVFRGKSEKEET